MERDGNETEMKRKRNGKETEMIRKCDGKGTEWHGNGAYRIGVEKDRKS
jgi:hypothetical protein